MNLHVEWEPVAIRRYHLDVDLLGMQVRFDHQVEVVIDVTLDRPLVDTLWKYDATLQLTIDQFTVASLFVLTDDHELISVDADAQLFWSKMFHSRSYN